MSWRAQSWLVVARGDWMKWEHIVAKTKRRKRGRPTGSNAGETRSKLIDAAIEVIVEEGVSKLSTVELTRRVGIGQSAFYAHFSHVEGCVQEAIDVLGERLNGLMSMWMAEFLEVERVSGASGNAGPTRQHIARVLPELVAHYGLIELLASRRSGTMLGERLDVLFDQAADLTARHIMSLQSIGGVEPLTAQQARFHGALIVAAVLEATRLVHAGVPVEEAVDLLTRHVVSSVSWCFDGWAVGEG